MNIYAFFVTFFAGISTLIGFLVVFYKGNKDSIICKSLGFASGVMISISVTDLIPNAIKLLSNNNIPIISIFIAFFAMFIGHLVSMMLSYKINAKKTDNSKLYKLGIITMLTIIIHNIPEGIATYITSENNMKLGISLAIAISMHNIPEGISISVPIYYSTNSKSRAFFYTLISGLSEVVGAIIAYLFLSKYVTDNIMAILYSLIAGIMLNISLNELLKESISKNKFYAFLYFIVGFILMVINHLLFN